MGGPADILVWEGPAGPRVALTQHPLAHEVDAPHDEERENDADDGPDGTAVGWGVVGGRLGDFCQSTDRKRWSALPTKGRVPVGRYRGPWRGWLCPGRREALGCWGWAAALTSGPPAHCPLGLPGAPSSSGSKLRLHRPTGASYSSPSARGLSVVAGGVNTGGFRESRAGLGGPAAGYEEPQEWGRQTEPGVPRSASQWPLPTQRDPGPSLAGLAKPRRSPEWRHCEGRRVTWPGPGGAEPSVQSQEPARDHEDAPRGPSGHPVCATARWWCSLDLVHYRSRQASKGCL